MAGSGGQRPLLPEPFQPSLQFLSPEELYHTSDGVKSKVMRVLSELASNFSKSEAERRKDKIAFDQQIYDLDSQLRERTNAVDNSSALLLEERKNSESYLEKYRNVLSQLNATDSKVAELERELNTCKIQFNQATTEKEDMLSIVEKRNAEIEKLTNDIKGTNDQLQSATVAKIEALAKVDELTSKEIELDYKEKQVEKEREWVSKQVQLLNEELDKKNVEVIEIQREASLKYLGVQTELTEKSEELRISEMALENVKKDNDNQEKHIERLMEKLKDAQTMELKMEENFRQELKSQKKIAELYKESSDEAGRKVEELEDAVSNLQALLKQSTERYGEIETRLATTQTKLQDEINERDKNVEALHKELSDANELLCNIKKQGMTDEMIESLSPAAAAASAMLKSSHSLTEIFSRYQTVYTELMQTKGENEKLNEYINQILQEITERAPTLRRQKEDYERCLKTIDALTTQLDMSLEEINDSKVENGHLKKTLGTVDRENNRLKVQLKDLAVQIKSLVKEVELNRGNYSFADPQDEASVVPDVESRDQSPTNSTTVITERLVTFRNIDELQAQNQHLLAVVRELSEAQEGSDKELNLTQLKTVQDALVAAKMELEDLKELKSRQESMIASITQQRDMYASLVKQQRTGNVGDNAEKLTDPATQEKIASLEKTIKENQILMQKLKEEYDTYRKDKGENDRITNDQLDRLRDDLSRMRTDNAKLASQTEYNNERAKIYTSNLETYKKNILVLEEKNKQYQLTILKHEQSMDTLKMELTTTQQNLARAEVNLSTTVQERNVLRDAKARLQAERDLFKREHSTQQMLQLNLQEIKNGLEMANSAGRIKLENQVESLHQENNALRRKNDIETDRFKDTVLAWDKMTKDLQAKLDLQDKEMESLKNEVSNSQGIIRTQRKEIEELLNKVSVLTGSSSAGNADQSMNSSTNSSPGKPTPGGTKEGENREGVLEKKVKDLTLQLIEAQTECKSLRQQMDFAKGSLEEYKMLAQAMEDQLNSANASSKNFSEELAERLACKDDIIRGIQGRLDVIEKESSVLKQEKETLQRESEDKIQFMNEEINRMRRELQAANSRLQGLTEENCTIKADMERHVRVSTEMQEKYERELSLHAQDVKTGGEIKSELDDLKVRVDEATRARLNIEETLNASKLSWEEKENNLNSEVERMKTNLEELETLNSSLQDQLINLTTQINSLRQVGAGDSGSRDTSFADTSLNVSFSENDAKTSEQWLQLIRYLRREKEIFRTRAELAQMATSRLESQLAHMEKQHEEVQKQLTEMQDQSHVSLITSAKQGDLLRKVETLSALTDSNRMLREEKDSALKEIQDLKKRLENLEIEIAPLRVQNTEYENKCEALNSENISLKQDATRWRARASALLEKSNKVNPEEMKKLQVERDNLQRQVSTLQESYKKQQQEVARLTLQIKNVQQNLSTQQLANAQLLSEKKTQLEESKKLSEQAVKVKGEAESLQSENSVLKLNLAEHGAELNKFKQELDKTQKLLEEHKNTVKTIKNIAKKYKKQYEDLLEEHKVQQEVNTSLEEEAAKVAAAAVKVSVDISTNTEEQPSDQSSSVEALNQEIARREVRVSEISSENEELKRDMENVKSECSLREDRMKLVMKTLREKLSQSNQQRSEVEGELNDYKTKLCSAESSSEEVSVRFAALRSQLDGRIVKLEKENKELRATAASGNTGESVVPGTSDMANINDSLQEENSRLKKELDMLRTRTIALEKQFKMQSQQQVAKGSSSGTEKAHPLSDPPKANIKPSIAGTSSQKQGGQTATPVLSRPPLTASIRPMSMQRKATVMPTTATAMPTQHSMTTQQQQAPSGLPPVSPSMFVAPVSQAQVSTSTPDQSSAMEQSHHLPMTSSTASVTNSSSTVRQATVQPTPAVTVTPIASTAAVGTTLERPPQGQSSSDRESGETGVHEDPSTSTSTSHMDDLEMGDSSEQVSSSESSTHQQMVPIAPIRSQQQQLDQVQQSTQSVVSGLSPVNQSGSQSGVEEPSPSTSTTGTRPTQSGKRGRESEVETSQESQHTDEPESKRQRSNFPMPIDREAEAMAHQQEEFSAAIDEQSENADQEADQGRTDEENQVPHSDTSVAKIAASGIAPTDSQEDDDSDVIIIDSDEEEEEEPQRVRGGREDVDEGGEEEEDLEEEDEEIVDSEGSSGEGEGGGDIESDEEDDDGGDGGNIEGLEDEQDDQELDHEEGREAESMEDNEGDGELKMAEEEGHEADTIEVVGEEDLQEEEQQDENQASGELEPSDQGSSQNQFVVSGSGGSFPSSSSAGTWGQSNVGASSRPVSVSRAPGRQERLPSLGRQHQLTPSSFQSGHGMFGDDIDDSIVPSTPTLFVPRRNDGFAEAVSSPQIPSQRFLFSSSDTITHSGASNSGLDDTRIDLHVYDDGSSRGSRQVPTTPLQGLPLDEPADLPLEIDQHGDSVEVPSGIPHEMSDIQPSSSDSSRFSQANTGAEIPAITITSALDSSLDSSPDQDRPLMDDRELVHMMDPNLDNARGGIIDLSRPEASVTSSDEDKIDTGVGVVGQTHQSAASSSSRTASPTPSTGQQGDQTNSGQSQQHRVRLITPIVWDQPTSSSSSAPTAPPRPVPRPIPRPARGRLMSRPIPQIPEPGSISPLRGGFGRQMRGTQPSARRSRPVSRSRGTMRGSPFPKGPY